MSAVRQASTGQQAVSNLSEENDRPYGEPEAEKIEAWEPTIRPGVTDDLLLRLRDIVKEEFDVHYAYVDARTNLPVFVVDTDGRIKERSTRLTEKLRPYGMLAVIRRVEIFEGTGEKHTVIKLVPSPPPRKKASYVWNIVLFLATIGTVLWTGWVLASDPAFLYIHENILHLPYNPFLVMFQFAAAIMGIVGLHEMGHLLASRRHRVEASLPYFIPGLPYYGTFGALIVQRSPPPTRDSLFDLGISGPLVGFLIALIVAILGMMMSPILSPEQYAQLTAWMRMQGREPAPLPSPLLFEFLWMLVTMGIPPNYVGYVHPMAFAGWIGFLITGLNYFPIGQLDGGHVARALFGDKYHQVASAIGVLILFLFGFYIMAILALFLFFGRHPGPVDDVSPLSTGRKILGVLSLLLPVLLIPPLPIW